MSKSKSTSAGSLRSFNQIVIQALKHYQDQTWLGNRSPLATSYFLSSTLDSSKAVTNNGKERGRLLQKLLKKSAESTWPGSFPKSKEDLLIEVETERQSFDNSGPKYLYILLELRYFREFFKPTADPRSVTATYTYLSVSESRFFEHLKAAQLLLIDALLKEVSPSLRLEQPTVNQNLFGRKRDLDDIFKHLRQGRSVHISGPGGIGKTSFAAQLADQWEGSQPFWYTFYKGLNDNIQSLLFSLAHYLHQMNRSQLWMYLLTLEGELNHFGQILGFLRNDLQHEKGRFLMCFDEIDLLNIEPAAPITEENQQILELIESIKKEGVLLLIGQRAVIDTDIHLALPPLKKRDISLFLDHAQLFSTSIADIYRVTDGNPRLIELVTVLLQMNDTADVLLKKHTSFQPLFFRLWKRLGNDEKKGLIRLSVFRSFAPETILTNKMLRLLESRMLLKRDPSGNVAVLPSFRPLIYEQLSPAQFTEAHLHAAHIRNDMAQFTQAAYHLAKAGLTEHAINYWFPHRKDEVNLGKAMEAKNIFNQIDHSDLSENSSKRLLVIQNYLSTLIGEYAEIVKREQFENGNPAEKLTNDINTQISQAYFSLGNTDIALQRYTQSISDLQEVNFNIIQNLFYKSQILLESSELYEVETIILKAKHQIAHMEALHLFYQGRYKDAINPFETARQMAVSFYDKRQIAWMDNLLAICYGNLGNMKIAQTYADKAIDYYQSVGDQLRLEGLRAEMAGFHLNMGQFEAVIEPAEQALSFFESVKHDHWVPHICSNLAEAYFELGQFETAKEYANRAIRSENQRVQPYAWYTLAQLKFQLKDIEASNIGFETGISIAEKNNDRFILAYLHRKYGELLLTQGKREDGIHNLLFASELFSDLKMVHEVQTTERMIDSSP